MATTTPIRKLRYDARANLAQVFVLLDGAPDLSRDERIARLDAAIQHVAVAAAALEQARAITADRDEDAHAAAKAAQAENDAKFIEIIQNGLNEG